VRLTLLLCAVLLLAPTAAAQTPIVSKSYSYSATPGQSDDAPDVTVTTPALEKGKRYRIEASGLVRYEAQPIYNYPAYDCDPLFCLESGVPGANPELGGEISMNLPPSINYQSIDAFVHEKRRVPYQPGHAYSETFRADKDGPIRIQGPEAWGHTPGRGTVEMALYEAGEPEIEIDYEMDPRFDENAHGRLPVFDAGKEITPPDGFGVLLKLKRRGKRGCDEKFQYRFKVDGAKLAATRDSKNECAYRVHLHEGVRKIEVRTRDGFGKALDGEERIDVQDFLIFGIGDSAGSGEGAPMGTPNWVDRRCHRSWDSGQAVAAKRIEDADERSSVTFVHLACSGGRIDRGLLGGYEGIEAASPDLPPQVDEIKRLAGTREIDAIEMSMGVNQLEFGAVLGHCVSNADCQNVEFHPGQTTEQFVRTAFGVLPTLYGHLASRLDELLPEASSSRVYITQYPELLRGDDGELCPRVLAIKGVGEIDAKEVAWLDQAMAAPLDAHVQGAALTARWTYVNGIKAAFHKHGYCASQDGWIRSASGSIATQGDKNGSMHPTNEGYRHIASFAVKRLKADLLPKGRPRRVREPGRGL
jgi:hypothetical protein